MRILRELRAQSVKRAIGHIELRAAAFLVTLKYLIERLRGVTGKRNNKIEQHLHTARSPSRRKVWFCSRALRARTRTYARKRVASGRLVNEIGESPLPLTAALQRFSDR